MVEGLLVLLLCQVVGTLLAGWLHLELPGAVLGMLLLLAMLLVRRPDPDAPVVRAGGRVLDELPVLFIPAGVGLVGCLGVIARSWLPVGAGLVVAWVAGLVATALAANLAMQLVRTPGLDALASQAADLVEDAERMEGIETDGQRAVGDDGTVVR